GDTGLRERQGQEQSGDNCCSMTWIKPRKKFHPAQPAGRRPEGKSQKAQSGGRLLIPPPTDAARRKGSQRLRCSMGRCSRRGSLKAAFRWWYQDAPVRGTIDDGGALYRYRVNWSVP